MGRPAGAFAPDTAWHYASYLLRPHSPVPTKGSHVDCGHHLVVTPGSARELALHVCKATLTHRANLAGTAPPLVMTFHCQVSHVAIGSLVQLSTGLYRSLAGTKRLACSGPPGPKRTFSGQNTEAPAYRTIQPLDFRRARPYDGRWALFSASSLT